MKKYKRLFKEVKQRFSVGFLANEWKIPDQDVEIILRLIKRPLSHNKADAVMQKVDKLMNGFGLEAIRKEGEHIDSYYFDIIGTYVNTGDTYDLTVVHNSDTGKFEIISWGDFYEYY